MRLLGLFVIVALGDWERDKEEDGDDGADMYVCTPDQIDDIYSTGDIYLSVGT